MAKEDGRLDEVIRIRKRVNNFVMMDKGFLEDDRLSYKAKGILAYLLSKPNDWKVIVGNLVAQSKDGKASVYAGLKELKECGYYQKVPIRNEQGTRIIRWESTVFEVPELSKSEEMQETSDFSLLPSFQEVENQDIENLYLENRERNNNNINNNIYIINNQSNQSDETDGHKRVLDLIKSNIQYDDLLITHAEDMGLIDDFLSIGVDAFCSIGDVIRIGDEGKPRELVKSNILKLDYNTMEYALDQFKSYNKRINKKKQFILTLLYNSVMECNSHYSNWVRADLGY